MHELELMSLLNGADDVKALIGDTPAFVGPGFLVPARSLLLPWCLEQKLRVVRQGGYAGVDGFNFFLPITSAACGAGCRSSAS